MLSAHTLAVETLACNHIPENRVVTMSVYVTPLTTPCSVKLDFAGFGERGLFGTKRHAQLTNLLCKTSYQLREMRIQSGRKSLKASKTPAVGIRTPVVIVYGGRKQTKHRTSLNGRPEDWMSQLIDGIRYVSQPYKSLKDESLYHGGGGNKGGSFRKSGGGDNSESFPQIYKSFELCWLVLCTRFLKRKVWKSGTNLTVWLLGSLLIAPIFLSRHIAALAEPTTTLPNVASDETEREVERERNYSKSDPLNVMWEVRGGQWRQLVVDSQKDEFVVNIVERTSVQSPDQEATSTEGKEYDGLDTKSGKEGGNTFLLGAGRQALTCCSNFACKLMLPEGYPESVTGDYLEYTLWRTIQGVASQISGVLSTQALLYAVGLGKGAIPTAAAVNWVLKDGIGYLSKIVLSKYGRHFDVHPKGWRLLADLLENVACGLELLTPAFPQLFVYLGAAAGAGRSAAGLIQAATRSCFYAGFAAQRNFADVIAKGEAQGMVSKSIGIVLGIALSSYIGSSGPVLVATFTAVTGIHMFCNLKSYQAVQLRTLNPYRASLVFGEYLRNGVVPSVSEVNAEEPIFSGVPSVAFKLKGRQEGKKLLSWQTKRDATVLGEKLELGAAFGDLIETRQEAEALFKLYASEKYALAERKNHFIALLKEGATAHDLLRMMLQVSYLHQLQTDCSLISRGLVADCKESGILKLSHDFMEERFEQVKKDLVSAHWITEGLVCRPKPYRLLDLAKV